jgi:phosphoribosylglycinamide formyltransferase-1
VQNVEHRLYPEALRLFAEDRIHRDGRTISIDAPEHSRHSPPDPE